MPEIVAPTRCPDCSNEIEVYVEPKSKITTHWCVNDLCPGRLADMLTYVADRTLLEIDGLGPEMAAKLAKDGYVTNLADLFEFLIDAQYAIHEFGEPKFSGEMANKGFMGAATIAMVKTLDRALTLGWDRWIAALGIPMIGLRLGKVLAEKLELSEQDFKRLPHLLLTLETFEIEGIGPHKKAELLIYARDPRFRDVCERLHAARVTPKPMKQAVVVEGSPLAGVTFVLTGEFTALGSRDYISDHLTRLGAVAKTGVTKKVSHLIVGSEPGAVKTQKAKALGIQMVDDTWLNDIFVKYGLTRVGGSFEIEDAE
jgi:DNA ligase (NAD+)